jgi:hypothetical protein
MPSPRARRLTFCVALVVGCEGATSPPVPVLTAVTPARGYSDRPIRLAIAGQGFWPSYRIDPGTGRRYGDASGFTGYAGAEGNRVALKDFGWLSSTELSATLEAGLPAGTHPLVLFDPRGGEARLPTGFVSLGPDRTSPTVAFASPAAEAPVAAGMHLGVVLTASDDPGGLQTLSWQAAGRGEVIARGDCPIAAGAPTATCSFDVPIPLGWREGDSLELRAQAIDQAPLANVGLAERSLRLAPKPSALSVTPAFGGVTGGTEVVIRGSGFLPGSRVLFGRQPLSPAGGVRLDQQTILGRTPAQPWGSVVVTVETPLGEAAIAAPYEYRLPPSLESIEPASAPPEGGTVLRVNGDNFTAETSIFLGTAFLSAAPLDGQVRLGTREIRGRVPPGQGKATVWAFDPNLGWSVLPNAFSWLPAAGGAGAPIAR